MKIGIVCSGGGAAGVTQVGMLQAVRDIYGYAGIDMISAASVGSLNATMFCQGQVDTLVDLWSNLRRKQVVGYARALNIFTAKSLYSPKPYYRLLEKYVDEELLKSSPIDYYFLATDTDTSEPVYLDRHGSDTITFLKGSSAIPVLFPEIKYGERFLVDGGVIDNSPSGILVRKGADLIYILHASPPPKAKKRNKPRRRLGSIFHLTKLLFRANQHSDRRLITEINLAVEEGRAQVGRRFINVVDVYPSEDVNTLEFNHKKAPTRIKDGYDRFMEAYETLPDK